MSEYRVTFKIQDLVQAEDEEEALQSMETKVKQATEQKNILSIGEIKATEVKEPEPKVETGKEFWLDRLMKLMKKADKGHDLPAFMEAMDEIYDMLKEPPKE